MKLNIRPKFQVLNTLPILMSETFEFGILKFNDLLAKLKSKFEIL